MKEKKKMNNINYLLLICLNIDFCDISLFFVVVFFSLSQFFVKWLTEKCTLSLITVHVIYKADENE